MDSFRDETWPYPQGPNKETTYNHKNAVTRQTVDLKEQAQRQEIAEQIAAVLKREGDKNVKGGVKSQTDYNLGMTAYIDESGTKHLLIALSGENESDLLADALSKEEAIKELGETYGFKISLITDTAESAKYYGYGTSREAFKIAFLKVGKEGVPGTFYYQYNKATENYDLFYYTKYNINKNKNKIPNEDMQMMESGVCKIWLPLEPKVQISLNKYATKGTPLPRDFWEAIINNQNNISKYKCSEPKLAAERQKSILFANGFIDAGESHFAVKNRNNEGLTVEPQCSCPECQFRTEKFQQPLMPLAGLSILLDNNDNNKNRRSPSPERRQLINPDSINSVKVERENTREPQRVGRGRPEQRLEPKGERAERRQKARTEEALQLIEKAAKLYSALLEAQDVEKEALLTKAAQFWAEAMRLDGGIAQEEHLRFNGVDAISDFREIAIRWFKQASEFQFKREISAEDNKGFQKALTLYAQLIPLMEAKLSQQIDANVRPEVIQQTKRELSEYYFKQLQARSAEINRLDIEHEFRKKNADRSGLYEEGRNAYRMKAILTNIEACYSALQKLTGEYFLTKQWLIMLEEQARLCIEHNLVVKFNKQFELFIQLAIRFNPDSPNPSLYQVKGAKQLADVAHAITQLEGEVKRLEQTVNEKKQEIKELKAYAAKLLVEASSLESEADEPRKEAQRLRKQADHAASGAVRLDSEAGELAKNAQPLQQEVNEIEQKIKRKEKQADNEKEKAQSLQQEIGKLELEAEKQEREAVELEKEAKHQEAINKKREAKETKEQAERKQNKLPGALQAAKDARRALSKLQIKYEQVKAKSDEAVKKLDTANKKAEQARKASDEAEGKAVVAELKAQPAIEKEEEAKLKAVEMVETLQALKLETKEVKGTFLAKEQEAKKAREEALHMQREAEKAREEALQAVDNYSLAKEKAEQVARIAKEVIKEEPPKPSVPKPSHRKKKSGTTEKMVKMFAEGCSEKSIRMLTPLEPVSKEPVPEPVSLESNNASRETAPEKNPKKKKRRKNKWKKTPGKQNNSGPSDPGSNSGPKLTGSL